MFLPLYKFISEWGRKKSWFGFRKNNIWKKKWSKNKLGKKNEKITQSKRKNEYYDDLDDNIYNDEYENIFENENPIVIKGAPSKKRKVKIDEKNILLIYIH